MSITTATVREGNQHIGRFSLESAPNEFIRQLVQTALSNGEATAKDEQGCEVSAVADQQELIIVAIGGIGFQVSLRGDFLGSMEFGSIDADGQYEQDDDEIIEAAREQFQIDESIPAVVR